MSQWRINNNNMIDNINNSKSGDNLYNMIDNNSE